MDTGVRTFAARAATRTAWALVAVAVLGATGNVGPRALVIADVTEVALSGSVEGLVPGRSAPLVVTVRNDSASAVTVTSVTVGVTAVGPAACARYLTVTAFAGRLDVPADSAGEVVLRASLASSLPDACRGASWSLDYSAR